MPAIESRTGKFHRVPLVWLAAVILMAAIGACILTIVLAHRYPDDSLPPGDSLLNMRLSRAVISNK